MALSATAIVTLERVKSWMGLSDTDAGLQVPAIRLWEGDTGTFSAATVAVGTGTVTLDTTPNTDDATIDITAAGNDTLTELVTTIAGTGTWEAQLLGLSDAASTDLLEIAATNALGLANALTLDAVDNRRLEVIIEGVTQEIETYLDRIVVSRDVSEIVHVDPSGLPREFTLANPDATAIERLSIDSRVVLRVEYTGSDPRAWVEVTDTSVKLLSRSGATTTENELTFASNATVSAMETAIDAVSGWSATVPSTVDTNEPTAFLAREGVRDAKDREVPLYSWEDFEGDYVVDYDAGSVSFEVLTWPFALRSRPGFNGSRRRIQVGYIAGFATVPADIEIVALQMVAEEFNQAGRDETLASESLDGYSYSRTAQAGAAIESRRDWRARLDKYVRLLP